MNMKLRESAEERLEKGTAPAMREWHVGTSALTLLHGLASAPQTASDALKLLHELQVHQVELDLQHEEAQQGCRQHTEDLAQYTALFDFAPFAYLSLDAEGVVIAANRIAAGWLAPGSGETQAWAGHHVEDLLAPECQPALRAMLTALRESGRRQTCAVQSQAGGTSAQAVASATPGGGQVLVALVPTGPWPVAAGL
jgi:hypothetical protein